MTSEKHNDENHQHGAHPSVTFVLMTFNQENYVLEAVESVLAQTYSPLEIIISDDCSTDSTYKIVEGATRDYSGAHKITLMRNESNMGLGRHFSKVCRVCRGDLIVMMSGDDVSLEHRVEVLVKFWIENGKRAVSMYSSVFLVDKCGGPWAKGFDYAFSYHPDSVTECIRMGTTHVLGASQAFSRKLLDQFEEFDGFETNEDELIPFRALLLDGILFLGERLVKYRHHESNYWSRAADASLTQEAELRRSLTILERNYAAKLQMRRQWLKDYEFINPDRGEDWKNLKNLGKLGEHQLAVAKAAAFSGAIRVFVYWIRNGTPRGAVILKYKALLKLRIAWWRFRSMLSGK